MLAYVMEIEKRIDDIWQIVDSAVPQKVKYF